LFVRKFKDEKGMCQALARFLQGKFCPERIKSRQGGGVKEKVVNPGIGFTTW
jgi:hypothetical protein